MLAGVFFEPPFFLELLVIALRSSLVACWTPSDLGDSSSGDLFVVFRPAYRYDGYSISAKGFLPTVVDIMVI